MAQSKSSKGWLKEHFADKYVIQSKQDGYRCRAAYKLLEIQNKDHILKKGMQVVDLGSAPGGWSQVAAKFIGDTGQIFALDLLEMDGFSGVTFIQGDFTSDAVYEKLLAALDGKPVDFILSDMAPNTSGNKTTDQAKMMHLMDLTVEFAEQSLVKNGGLLVKVFQGVGYDDLLKTLRGKFSRLVTRKPDASRARSKEVYLLAMGYKA